MTPISTASRELETFDEIPLTPSPQELDFERIQLLVGEIFRGNEKILKISKIEGVHANHLWTILTSKTQYIWRESKLPLSSERFSQLHLVCMAASQQNVGPKVVGCNASVQALALQFLIAYPVSPFEGGAEPQKVCTRALVEFQGAMRFLKQAHPEMAFPQHAYLKILRHDAVLPVDHVPMTFFICLRKTRELFASIQPWLSQNTVLIHGNFCRKNALLSQDYAPQRATLIDFDQCSLGHPYYDIAQFSLRFPQNLSDEVLRTYLNGQMPGPHDRWHVAINQIAHLVLEAFKCFEVLNTHLSDRHDRFTLPGMEAIIQTPELPKFESTDGDRSTKGWQKRAAYALGEAMQRLLALPFSESS